jgi:hypothetical protein
MKHRVYTIGGAQPYSTERRQGIKYLSPESPKGGQRREGEVTHRG